MKVFFSPSDCLPNWIELNHCHLDPFSTRTFWLRKIAFSNIFFQVKLKPPQVNFVLEDEDQKLISTHFKVIQHKRFGVQSKSGLNRTSKPDEMNRSTSDVKNTPPTCQKSDKKSSRRLSVAERLILSQGAISPMISDSEDPSSPVISSYKQNGTLIKVTIWVFTFYFFQGWEFNSNVMNLIL